MKRPEILAPAGSLESLIAALRTGANAVYLGGKKFSARNNADNFSIDELSEGVKLCHRYGAKIYLAVNTIISDNETKDFCSYIKSIAEMGIDGYIVQDLGAAEIIKNAVPDAVLHASTQMSVHTVAGVRLLHEFGFSRVVPARELSAGTLEKICHEDIEVEVFVHGALCMSVSGQCYISAIMGSRSANRGCCGQACRLPFSASGKNNCSALSLKDLSLLESIDKLKKIGVDSLKIEGRMKRPEYISASVNELKKSLEGEAPDMQLLRGIFSRSGFTDGYFYDNRENMFGIREKDDVIAAKSIIPKIHELYRNERAVHKVNFFVRMKKDNPLSITALCDDISVCVQGDYPEKSLNSSTDFQTIQKQLSKLGNTVFEFNGLDADIDEGLFISAKKINEMRRNITEKLTSLITEKNTPEYTITTDYTPKKPDIKFSKKSYNTLPLRTFCHNTEQAVEAVKYSEYVIVPMDIINDELLKIIPKEKLIISPPRFIVNENNTIMHLEKLKKSGFEHLFCHTLDTAAIGKNLGFRLHGNFSLNIFNSFSAEFLHKIGFEDCIFSIEATLEQIRNVKTNIPSGAVIYGRIPMMLTRNCPIKNEVGCKNCTGHLTDRTLRKLPVSCSRDFIEILNSDILYMSDRLNEFSGISFGIVMLYDENTEQTRNALNGIKPAGNITRGLYYRGVSEKI